MSDNLTLLASKKNALLLGAFAAVCTALVSITYVLTADTIAKQEQQQTLTKITEVLDPAKFDNNPLENCVLVSLPEITGSETKLPVYRATLQQQSYALVFQTQTSKGYNGLIKVIAATDKHGVVQGTRVLSHKETPGLGDKIDLEKSDWILSLTDKQVRDIKDPKWFVKKDGGDFDQFTGATITPRAVVNQVRTSTYRMTEQFSQIFEMPNDCEIATVVEEAEDKTEQGTKPLSPTSTENNEVIDDNN
ncbi:MAG: electron transport complex subunit RsxG [Gammaproteobacteria bacterium]|nr:electron transport complex subunit RsxG [Gammaproteobacteria bacterium]